MKEIYSNQEQLEIKYVTTEDFRRFRSKVLNGKIKIEYIEEKVAPLGVDLIKKDFIEVFKGENNRYYRMHCIMLEKAHCASIYEKCDYYYELEG